MKRAPAPNDRPPRHAIHRFKRDISTTAPVFLAGRPCVRCCVPLLVLLGDPPRDHCVRCLASGDVERLPRVDELALGLGCWSDT